MINIKMIKEMIKEYEQMINTLTLRLQMLKQAIGVSSYNSYNENNSIKSEIEQKRNELMSEAEMIRNNAMKQAKEMMGNIEKPDINKFMPMGLGKRPNFHKGKK